MKTKKIKIVLSVISTMILSYGALYAWNGLTASDGDTLTHTKWNELVTKVDSISSESGKVGIGTDTPYTPLYVKGNNDEIDDPNTNGIVTIKNETTQNWQRVLSVLSPNIANGDFGGLILFGKSDAIGESGQISFVDDDIEGEGYIDFSFRSLGANKMVIKENGNIGIGNASPKAKLDVDGGIKIAGSTCDTDHVGTMQYDSTTDTFKGCRNNGGSPAWVSLH